MQKTTCLEAGCAMSDPAGWKMRINLMWALLALVAATGCGPVQSTSRIGEAAVALERARVAQADQKAPYEYYSAKFYMHKSREEWGYSDFEASFDYATEAKRAAEAALSKAKEDPWKGSPADKNITPEEMKDTGRPEGNPAADHDRLTEGGIR